MWSWADSSFAGCSKSEWLFGRAAVGLGPKVSARSGRLWPTAEAEGPQGVGLVDARPRDALNLAVLTQAPVFVAPEMLADCIGRQEADSAEAALPQRAVAAGADGRPQS